MANSPDHPQLRFVQAKGFTAGRPDGPPLWIVVHDMEAGEYSGRAESTAAYFANPSDGRRVSSHYTVDDDSVVQCVLLGDSAWTVGNRKGNNRGINWELSGFARQSRAEWLDEFGLRMFAQMKPIVRADAAEFSIPLVRRTRDELQAMVPGVTSHADLAAVFGGSDHTDPGPWFPWDVFLKIMTDEEDDMAADVFYKIESSDTKYDGKVYVSNRIHRRGPLRNPGSIQGPATAGATPLVLTDAMRGADTWDAYLDAVAGPLFPASTGAGPAEFVIALTGTAKPKA